MDGNLGRDGMKITFMNGKYLAASNLHLKGLELVCHADKNMPIIMYISKIYYI